MQPAFVAFHLADEVDARRAVQLADDDTFGAVDDELTTAEHDRHVAEIDFLFDRLLFGETQPHAERATVGEAQLTTFVRFVARLAKLVVQVLEPQGFVVAFDREDFAQDALDALVFALVVRCFELQKRVVAARLDVGKTRDVPLVFARAETTDFFRAETSVCRSGHI